MAICESVAGASGSSSEMLTPAATLRSGVKANFSNGVIVDRILVRRGISGSSATASSVAARQSVIEPGPLEAGAEPARAQLPRFEAQPVAGVLLDEIVRVVDGDDRRETDVAVADAEIQVTSPALLRVKERVRSERLEAQPRRQLLLASLVHEPDAANLAPALDSARHVVARQLAFDALLQPIGVAGIEALADERREVVAQRLCQLLLGHTA